MKKMHLKMSSVKWHLSCLSLNVLIQFHYKLTHDVVIDVVIGMGG